MNEITKEPCCETQDTAKKSTERVSSDLHYEVMNLTEKVIRLRAFIANKAAFENIDSEQALLLIDQEKAMSSYLRILRERIELLVPSKIAK